MSMNISGKHMINIVFRWSRIKMRAWLHLFSWQQKVFCQPE